MRVHHTLFSLILTVAASFSLATNVQAGEDWEFNLAPFYLWGINISGDQAIGSMTGDLEVEFDDIFDNLDSAFIVHFEGMHKSNWGFLVDINFIDLENKQTRPPGITRKIDLDLTLSEMSGLYRWDYNPHKFDVIFGVRYARIANKIGFLNGPDLVDAAQDWIDPLIGGRWIWGFADNWSLITRGDIGGFGIGSNFSWQALGMIEWQPFKYASLIAGYRAIGMDYEDGSQGRPDYFNFDATVHGPVIGINFRW